MDVNNVTYLTLEGHVDLQNYRYIYFLITLTVYVLIIIFNVVVIFVIFINKHLHEPMYIFIAVLLCNALFGATALCPKLLTDLLSEKQITSYHGCLFQALFVYWYATSDFTLLSAMAYDRYVSICKPLQYATILKVHTVRKLIFLSWFVPGCELGVALISIYQLKLCKFKLNRIYCDSYSILKLSCKETSANNSYGLFVFSVAVFPPLIFVIYSYIRILTVCWNNSKDFKRKALQTCLPHLFIFINFSVNICFEVINTRLESSQMPQIVAMILSVEYLLIPPLFNPIVYGLKLQEIWKSIKRLISWKKRTGISF